MDDQSNVIDFVASKATNDNEEPLKYAERTYKECRHRRRLISFQERIINCRECGRELDPYKVLDEIAHEYSGWKVFELKERLAEMEKLSKKIDAKRRTDLMTEDELKLSPLEFRAAHECDPERMWRKGDMIHCYCGSAFNRHSYPKQALEVFKAHERMAQKAKFILKKWEK